MSKCLGSGERYQHPEWWLELGMLFWIRVNEQMSTRIICTMKDAVKLAVSYSTKKIEEATGTVLLEKNLSICTKNLKNVLPHSLTNF